MVQEPRSCGRAERWVLQHARQGRLQAHHGPAAAVAVPTQLYVSARSAELEGGWRSGKGALTHLSPCACTGMSSMCEQGNSRCKRLWCACLSWHCHTCACTCTLHVKASASSCKHGPHPVIVGLPPKGSTAYVLSTCSGITTSAPAPCLHCSCFGVCMHVQWLCHGASCAPTDPLRSGESRTSAPQVCGDARLRAPS